MRKLLLIVLLLPSLLQAASITNIATGSWTNTATWAGGVVPGSADAAVVTGYTVTVHSQPVDVSALTISGGTLTLSSGATNTAWSFNHAGGTVNYSNTVLVASNYSRASTSALNPYTWRLLMLSNSTINFSLNSPAVAGTLSCAQSNTTTTFTSSAGGIAGVGQLELNGGTLWVNNSSRFHQIVSYSPIVAAKGSLLRGESNGLGLYVWMTVPRGATTDISRLADNLSIYAPRGTYETGFNIVAEAGTLRSTILLTNVAYVNWLTVFGKDTSSRMTTASGPKLDWIILNSTVQVQSVFDWFGQNTGEGGSLYLSNSVLAVERNTNNSANVSGYTATAFNFWPSATNVLSLYDSAIYSTSVGFTFPNYVHLTNSTIICRSSTASAGNYAGPSSGAFSKSTNDTIAFFQNNNTGGQTINGVFDVLRVARLSGSGSLYCNGAFYAKTLSVDSGCQFAPNEQPFTASNVFVRGGTFSGGASLLDLQESLSVVSGAFSPDTSTLRFNNTTSSYCTATNLNNLIVATPRLDLGRYDPPVTVADASGSGNTGTNVGSATSVVGTNGRALQFNGTSQRVSVPSNSAFSFERSDPFTVSFWVNPSSNFNGEAWGTLMSKTSVDAKLTGYWAYINPSASPTTTVDFVLCNDWGINTDNLASSASNVVFGAWNHVVCVTDGTGRQDGMTIYVNGVAKTGVGAGALGARTLTNTGALHFGYWGRSSTPFRWFNGSLDDIRIYNRALSSNEAVNVYSGSAPTNGLVGYWPLDDYTWPVTTINGSLSVSNGTPDSLRSIANARLSLPRATLLQYAGLSNSAVYGQNLLTVYGSSVLSTGKIKRLPNHNYQ